MTRSAGPVRTAPTGGGATGLGGRVAASAIDASVDALAIPTSVRPVASARRIPRVLMSLVSRRLMVEWAFLGAAGLLVARAPRALVGAAVVAGGGRVVGDDAATAFLGAAVVAGGGRVV